MTPNEQIQQFLACSRFAVAGASTSRAKYGNKVLRCYLQHGLDAVAIHPRESEIEGVPAFARVAELPDLPRALSVITPPAITEQLVEEAAAAGVRQLWLQPGAESPTALRRGRDLGLEIIAGGPCLLVVLGFQD